MNIEIATLKHTAELARLFDLYRQFYDCEPDLKLAKAFITERIVNEESRIFIAMDGEKAVGEIQDCLGLPQAIVSQHLAKMRGWDIVESRRDGIHVFYRIIEPKVSHILDCIRHCDLAE